MVANHRGSRQPFAALLLCTGQLDEVSLCATAQIDNASKHISKRHRQGSAQLSVGDGPYLASWTRGPRQAEERSWRGIRSKEQKQSVPPPEWMLCQPHNGTKSRATDQDILRWFGEERRNLTSSSDTCHVLMRNRSKSDNTRGSTVHSQRYRRRGHSGYINAVVDSRRKRVDKLPLSTAVRL